MYALQYGNAHEARSTLDGISPGRGLEACRSCAACAARCSHAVDVARRIDDLKLLSA
jgi:succinate dehydrogenase/fumarate reductase-like Fe-S protein